MSRHLRNKMLRSWLRENSARFRGDRRPDLEQPRRIDWSRIDRLPEPEPMPEPQSYRERRSP